MLKRMCTAKIANLKVTRAAAHYDGSLGVDALLLKAVGILPYEMVIVANVSNGKRLETYTIPEPRGSGNVCLYGGAARMGKRGDELIIMAYGYTSATKAKRLPKPRVIHVKGRNRLP